MSNQFNDLFKDAPHAVNSDGSLIEFRKLTRKFVDSEKSIPKAASDVLYYTLAVGHHTGIIDCFECALEIPIDMYEKIVSILDDDEARFKFGGVLRFGEIEIDKSHVPMLVSAMQTEVAGFENSEKLSKLELLLTCDEQEYYLKIMELLYEVQNTPSVYLMVRRVA